MIIYLATPYSHYYPEVRQQRFEIVNAVAAQLMAEGLHIFSPISHTHPIAIAGDLPKGWDFWEEYDRRILAVCGKVIVLKQPGWERSTGVQSECKIAEEMGIPIEYMEVPAELIAEPV